MTTNDVVARLWQDEEQVGKAGIDDLGNFMFSALAAGRYELIISGPEFEIHVQELLIP